jgi:hypothetical protein
MPDVNPVYSQQVVEFASDNTKLVMLKGPVTNHLDDLLRDLKAIAEAFETSMLTSPWDDARGLGDAISRAYKELGYIR